MLEKHIEKKEEIITPNEVDSRLWYVIQTKPQNEHRVEAHLLNQGIETFLPLCASYHSCKGMVVKKITPFFPSYLFARFALEHDYHRVKWTRGVKKVLGFGNGPLPISEKIVLGIKERVGEDNLIKWAEDWQEGDLVEVISGPFQGLQGIFQQKMSAKGRVKILLSLVGVDVPVQISQWQLKKALV